MHANMPVISEYPKFVLFKGDKSDINPTFNTQATDKKDVYKVLVMNADQENTLKSKK